MEAVIKIVYLLFKLLGGCDRLGQEEKKTCDEDSSVTVSSFSFTHIPKKSLMLLIKYGAVMISGLTDRSIDSNLMCNYFDNLKVM